MKRPFITRFTGPFWLVAVLAAGGLASAAVAQSPVPMATADDAVVGTWWLDTNVDDPGNPPTEAIFHADGTYFQADGNGIGVGVWESTGPDTGIMTFVAPAGGPGGSVTRLTVRAAFQVAADGRSLTETYTVEFSGGGAPAGEMGPGAASGTRVVVEPMGSPVVPFRRRFLRRRSLRRRAPRRRAPPTSAFRYPGPAPRRGAGAVPPGLGIDRDGAEARGMAAWLRAMPVDRRCRGLERQALVENLLVAIQEDCFRFAAGLADQVAMTKALIGYRRQVRDDGVIGSELVFALLLALIPPRPVIEPMVAFV